MFGLMKPYPCALPGEEKKHYRLYYCGICKTIGTRYGHKMRLFLNHDIAFFAEILSRLPGGSEDTRPWDAAFYRSNCFVLPGNRNKNKTQVQIPFFFSIAAAIVPTVVTAVERPAADAVTATADAATAAIADLEPIINTLKI